MKPINEMTLSECLDALHELYEYTDNVVQGGYAQVIADRIHDLTRPKHKDLWTHMREEHGLTLLESELWGIIYAVNYAREAVIIDLHNELAKLESKHRWIPVSERLPTKEDADEYECVLRWSDVEPLSAKWHTIVKLAGQTGYTHWRSIDAP